MNIGLVLEGGGMRGVFTAGVTDCFLDNKIFFPYVIGVSAGGRVKWVVVRFPPEGKGEKMRYRNTFRAELYWA